MRLTHANICVAQGKLDDAEKLYVLVINMAEDNEGTVADIAAIAKVKLAELRYAAHPEDSQYAYCLSQLVSLLTRLRRLVKESIAHFEDQTSRRGQAQYARALHYKALLSGDDTRRQSTKRARQALVDVCEEYGLSLPPKGELSKKDFESILELGWS